MKLPHLVVHECNTGRTRTMRLRGDSMDYAAIGKFVMKTMASMVKHCSAQGTKPCMHVVPRSLTKEEHDKIDKVDWHLEAEELMHAVQRGEPAE